MMEQPKGGNRSRKYSGKRRGKKRKEEDKKELAIAIMQKTKDNMANGYTPHYE